MNPVLGIIGNMLGGNNGNGSVGNAQANSMVNNTQNINNVLGIFNAVKNSSNPMHMLKSMSNSNPMIKQAFDCVEENGGDIKKAFYTLSEKYGIDPNNIMGMIK